MAQTILSFLEHHGPSRSSAIVEALVADGVAAEAARQRVARVRAPIRRFPLRLLPKNESFLYLDHQRNREAFWDNFLQAMRDTNSIFGIALDGLSARGGMIPSAEFPIISGAPINPMRGQLTAAHVEDVLRKASFIENVQTVGGGSMLRYRGSSSLVDASSVTDGVVLDGLREWTRRLGFASYNSIAIRGEPELQPIGPFLFDLSGPSYLRAVRSTDAAPGFFVADVFSQATLDEHHIRYFVRKVSVLSAMKMGTRLLPMLVADGFTASALTAGHAAGISLATTATLFGRRAGAALASLAQTLQNAAAYASADNADRIVRLLNDLSDIEGRAGNLRGVLFELIAAYLARRDAVSIEMGVVARDPETGKFVDVDVLKIKAMGSEVICIECKGKEPGGVVEKAEVEEWLKKLPVMRAHLAAHHSLREAHHQFEIWTSGTFSEEALALLRQQKQARTRTGIDWKDGQAVLALARAGKEKAAADALQQHFLKHPLAEVVVGSQTLLASSTALVPFSSEPA